MKRTRFLAVVLTAALLCSCCLWAHAQYAQPLEKALVLDEHVIVYGNSIELKVSSQNVTRVNLTKEEDRRIFGRYPMQRDESINAGDTIVFPQDFNFRGEESDVVGEYTIRVEFQAELRPDENYTVEFREADTLNANKALNIITYTENGASEPRNYHKLIESEETLETTLSAVQQISLNEEKSGKVVPVYVPELTIGTMLFKQESENKSMLSVVQSESKEEGGETSASTGNNESVQQPSQPQTASEGGQPSQSQTASEGGAPSIGGNNDDSQDNTQVASRPTPVVQEVEVPPSSSNTEPSNPEITKPSDTATDAPSNTVTNTPSDTVTDAPSDTVTNTPSDTVTNAPSDTVTDAPSDTETNKPADTVTNEPAGTDTDTPTPTTATPKPNQNTTGGSGKVTSKPTTPKTNAPSATPASTTPAPTTPVPTTPAPTTPAPTTPTPEPDPIRRVHLTPWFNDSVGIVSLAGLTLVSLAALAVVLWQLHKLNAVAAVSPKAAKPKPEDDGESTLLEHPKGGNK